MGFREFSARALELRQGRRGGEPALVVLRVVDSTQRLAQRLVRDFGREDVPPPAADFLAFAQDSGRGRDDRTWSSPAGAGVYATAIRPLAADRVQLLPLAVGVALVEALLPRVPACRLKWPNDLVVAGSKLGGILIEAVTRGDAGTVAIVGFGVNVAADVARFGAPAVTSLEHEGAPPEDLAGLAEELLAAVDAATTAPVDAAAVMARYRSLSAHRPGEDLTCRIGGARLTGTFRGFDEHGFLRLEVDGEERRIAAGEVISCR